MKKYFLIIFFLFSLIKPFDTSEMLMIFFIRTGNTGLFANYINEILNNKTYQIIPVTPYTTDLDTMLDIARQERNNNVKPEIKNL